MAKFEVTERIFGVVLNIPEIFERADFQSWLNNPRNRTATWHDRGGEPGEYSDVFLLVGGDYGGSDADMPHDVWEAICETVYDAFRGGETTPSGRMEAKVIVQLTNLAT